LSYLIGVAGAVTVTVTFDAQPPPPFVANTKLRHGIDLLFRRCRGRAFVGETPIRDDRC
jgi:hypothetical protein